VIVAVDPSHSARDAALASGATHVAEPDAVEGLVADLLGGRGVDAVIECVGSTTTFQTAWRTTRRGGRVVVVGASRPDQLTQIPLVDVMLSGKRVIGSVHGESVGGRDLPRYLALAEQGRLDLDALIGRHVRLDEMPDVIAHQVAGSGRTVMVAG
jgi:S-(hydroxymethyl)glutathione dehydrogenase/alcohol dehydrogenase